MAALVDPLIARVVAVGGGLSRRIRRSHAGSVMQDGPSIPRAGGRLGGGTVLVRQSREYWSSLLIVRVGSEKRPDASRQVMARLQDGMASEDPVAALTGQETRGSNA